MKCPKCGSQVAEGQSICDECDYIVDKSFLGDDFTDQGSASVEDVRYEDESLDSAAQPRDGGHPPKRKQKNREQTDPELQAPQSLPQGQTAPGVSPLDHSLRQEGRRIAKDVEGNLLGLWTRFKNFEHPDKIAVAGAVGLFFFTFFPWVSFGPETLIGLDVGGWFALLLSAATVALVHLREQKHWRDHESYVLYTQMGVAAITVLFIIVKMSSIKSARTVEAQLDWQRVIGAEIHLGLILCFFSAITILAGALLTFHERIWKHR